MEQSSRPSQEGKEAKGLSENESNKENKGRTDTPARPYANDMEAVNRLRRQLTAISASKDSGLITSEQANAKAVEAIGKTREAKSKYLQRKPLDYLERICRNGWVSEAVKRIPELYPYLDHPDRWICKDE